MHNSFATGSVVVVDNRMQTGYSFELKKYPGSLGVGFAPAFTPREMLQLGVFEGHYMTDCKAEYPSYYFEAARINPLKPDPRGCNAFGVKARDGLRAWKTAGWIDPQDPRGWFEWYCRYWMGRRSADDNRQIARWLRFANRHSRVIIAADTKDKTFRAKSRQSLLQWAHDPFPDIATEPFGSVAAKTFSVLGLPRIP